MQPSEPRFAASGDEAEGVSVANHGVAAAAFPGRGAPPSASSSAATCHDYPATATAAREEVICVAELMDVREREGRYEILTRIDEPGHEEFWEPLATEIVRSRLLEVPGQEPVYGVSLADALRAEGWMSPEELGDFKEWLAAAKRVVDASNFGPHEDTPFDDYNEWVAAVEALKRLVVVAEFPYAR